MVPKEKSKMLRAKKMTRPSFLPPLKIHNYVFSFNSTYLGTYPLVIPVSSSSSSAPNIQQFVRPCCTPALLGKNSVFIAYNMLDFRQAQIGRSVPRCCRIMISPPGLPTISARRDGKANVSGVWRSLPVSRSALAAEIRVSGTADMT